MFFLRIFNILEPLSLENLGFPQDFQHFGAPMGGDNATQPIRGGGGLATATAGKLTHPIRGGGGLATANR